MVGFGRANVAWLGHVIVSDEASARIRCDHVAVPAAALSSVPLSHRFHSRSLHLPASHQCSGKLVSRVLVLGTV